MSDDYGSCPECGDAWFDIAKPPDAPFSTDPLSKPGVCIDDEGNVTGYAGVLSCLGCGAIWRHKNPQRPFLRLVQDEEMETGTFDDIVADVEDHQVVSFTHRSEDFLPEITASGFDGHDFDQALALAFKGVLAMGLTSIGFFHEDDDEDFFDWED